MAKMTWTLYGLGSFYWKKKEPEKKLRKKLATNIYNKHSLTNYPKSGDWFLFLFLRYESIRLNSQLSLGNRKMSMVVPPMASWQGDAALSRAPSRLGAHRP